MKLKNKVIATVVTYLVVLLILPLVLVNLSRPHEAMGVFMLFFFIINPRAFKAKKQTTCPQGAPCTRKKQYKKKWLE